MTQKISLRISLTAIAVATLSASAFIGCTDTAGAAKGGAAASDGRSVLTLATTGGTGAAPATMPVDANGVPMLKDIYAKDFFIGTALDFRGANDYSPKEIQIVKAQYNIITPENSMKPQSVHPAEDRWTFETADRLVAFCQENNIKVHGHTLAWHAQTPNWFFTGADGQPVARDVAIARLKAHIEGEVGHFKGKIFSWDVVNEAIDDRGPATGENLRNSPWVRAIGPDYITMAFKFAHDADPKAELFYNDYNIERGGKHANSLALLKRLIKDGAPITGVGIQGHWSINGTPLKDVDQAIADYKALGLKVSISELDLTMGGQNGGQLTPGGGGAPGGRRGAGAPATGPATGPAATSPAAPGGRGRGTGGRGAGTGTPPTPEQLKAQADMYAKLFEIFEKYSGTVERVTFWGTNDARTWRPGQSPLLYDNNNNPKPAIQAIADVKMKK